MTKYSDVSPDVERLIYASRWKRNTTTGQGRAEAPAACLFVVPAAQHTTRSALGSISPGTPVVRLDPGGLLELQARLRQAEGTRLVFVSEQKWADGIDDLAITSFLRFLKVLADLRSVTLDIVTVTSIACPAYRSVTHPIDALYLGLGQTAAKEFAEWRVRCFSLARLDREHLLFALHGVPLDLQGEPIGVSGHDYWTRELAPADLPRVGDRSPFRQRGTYMIIGANGGLGGLLSRFLAEKYRAKLILVGRRPENSERCDALSRLGAEVSYESVDLSDPAGVQAVLDKHPQIDGIVHSALVLKDSALVNMSEESLMSVLLPKVHGTFNLLNALRHRRLDFVLFFSSIQSHIANAGQANYTAACACKDALASVLNDVFLVNSKVINWGFWGSVGIVASDSYRERMTRLEIGSIEPAEGLQIVERFLGSPLEQIAVIKASDRALERLNVRPHGTGMVPAYDRAQPAVAHNEALSTALDDYSRARLHQTVLPIRVAPKFEKLMKAISQIPYVAPIDKRDILSKWPDLKGHVTLLDECLDNYPKILSGEIDPLSVMFPDGSFALVEPVYRGNPIADYFNKAVGEIVSRFVRSRKGAKVRILEIGAGTGSTTQFVLPAIKGRDVEYTFTDLSLAFLHKAKTRFAQYDFVKYGVYDVEQRPKFERKFDVVIATNVIHATKRLDNTLRNVRELLADEGVFLLNEITSAKDFATLIFGLTDGWWLSTDANRIPNSPLLSGQAWRALLSSTGFGDIQHHGSHEQQVIVARTGPAAAPVVEPPAPAPGERPRREQVEGLVKKIIAQVMLIAEEEVDRELPFNSYGIDSLISMELVKPLKEVVGYLPATLLFEYPSVARLSEYLLSEHSESLQRHLGSGARQAPHRSETVSTKQFVKQVISSVMHLDIKGIEDDVPFKEYGIDSLISLEVMKPIRDVFGYLPLTLLFEYPSVERLAEYLQQQFPDKVGAATVVPRVAEVPKRTEAARDDDIAIIGMAGRFPDSEDCDEFWQNLLQGKQCISDTPALRWDGDQRQNAYTRKGGFVADIEAFDNGFFNMTPLDAERTDPQERLFMQTAYEAMLDSGHSKTALAGSSTGVFVGVMNGGYAWHTVDGKTAMKPTSLFWSIANRVSYVFDWKGPSMAIDTACSSSLTALHLACQSLKSRECEMVVVGGVNLIVHPRHYELLCGMHMLSRSDRCRPFGKGADGFVDGEGVCAVVIKRYSDAIRDRDRIHAVIRGSAINAGGFSNGYSAPNPNAQAEVIQRALERAGVPTASISYVEAHGTGTELGDPIELKGLSTAFEGVPKQSVALGSVKGNIGHLESAAGLAGLIKVLLQLRHGTLVPSINCEEENPHLKLAESPFVINRAARPWTAPGDLRFASVSSFGAGGANAHVVLQECVQPKTNATGSDEADYYFIVLSAKSRVSLQSQLDRLREWLEGRPVDLSALSYTLCCARDHFEHRVGFPVRSVEELRGLLKQDLQEHRIRSGSEAPAGDLSELIAEVKRRRGQYCGEADALVALYVRGANVPWSELCGPRDVVSVPGYSFEKKRFWVESAESPPRDASGLITHHTILGRSMAPAALSLSLLYEKSGYELLEDVTWRRVITSLDDVRVEMEGVRFAIRSGAGTSAFFDGRLGAQRPEGLPRKFHQALQDASFLAGSDVYSRFSDRGYVYGSTYQTLQWLKVGQGIVKGCIMPGGDLGYRLSPSLLDAGLQTAIMLQPLHNVATQDEVLVPFHLRSFVVNRAPKDEPVYCYCLLREGGRTSRSVTYDVYFTDADTNVLVLMEGFVSLLMNKSALHTDSGTSVRGERDDRSGAVAAYEVG